MSKMANCNLSPVILLGDLSVNLNHLKTQISSKSGSNNHSLSIADLPLTQEKVETAYADIFQGLGKFPGDP